MTRPITCAAAALALAAVAVLPSQAASAAGRDGRIAYSIGAILPNPDPEAPSQVYTVNPDGSDVRQLTHVALPLQAGDPAFSPDGRQLLFVRNSAAGPFQVWIMRSDGSGQRKLLDDPGHDAFLPRWSPDGSHFLFSRCSFVFGFLECAIFRASINGTNLHAYTGGHNVDFSADYASDGSYIAFDSNRNNAQSAIWRTTGAGPRRITAPFTEAFWPDVSPNGTRILFTDNFDRPDSRQPSMHVDGTDDRTLAAGCFGRWAPSGTRIVYDGGLNCDKGLTIADADGTHAHTVVAVTDQLVLSDWGPTS